ncbi:MAG: hypothetical protein OEW08_13100, partial [Gammaproteobacteria bacterium]|nr:hypothetical protein [Gammaproteobacteria bacterium]
MSVVVSGCGKASKSEGDPQSGTHIDGADHFTRTFANGETKLYKEEAYSATDPIPTAYSKANFNFLPRYWWTETESGNELLSAAPSPGLNLEFASDLNYLGGTYNRLIRLEVPGTTVGDYYANDNFRFIRYNEDESTGEWYDIYLDKVSLLEVGKVGEPIKGTFDYWACSRKRCQLRHSEFAATREADVEFKAQGSLNNPYYLGNDPVMYKDNLVAKLGQPSYYKIAIKSGATYQMQIWSEQFNVDYSLFTDAAFENEICSNRSSCRDINVYTDAIYLKVQFPQNERRKVDSPSTVIEGSGFAFYLEQQNFSNTQATATNLGVAPLLRKQIYAPGRDYSKYPYERYFYYKIAIDADKVYTVANSRTNWDRNGDSYQLQLLTSSAFGDLGDCKESLWSGATCSFLTGPAQTDVIVKTYSYDNTMGIFSIVEAVFESVGKPDAPIEIDRFDFWTDAYENEGVYQSVVGGDASYYKVNVLPNQLYRVDLRGVYDQIELTVYTDAGYTQKICTVVATKGEDGRCEFTTAAEQKTAYVRVDGSKAAKFHGSNLYFGINPLYTSQGTIGAPVTIPGSLDTPFAAQVTPAAASFYKLDILKNTALEIFFDDHLYRSGRVNAEIYESSDFTTGFVCSLEVDSYENTCSYLNNAAEGKTLYIKLTGSQFATGIPVNITVQQRVFRSQGKINAAQMIGSAPLYSYSAENGMGASYFKVRVGKNRTHRVSLTPNLDDLNVHVYGDNLFSTELCQSSLPALETDSCQFTSPAGGYVYVKVTGENATTYRGSEFNLSLTQIYANVGTLATPLALGGAPISAVEGSVSSSGFSLYSADVAIGKAYTVKFSHTTDIVDFQLYNDASYSDTGDVVCSGSARVNDVGRCLTTTTTTNKLWVRVTSANSSRFRLTINEANANEG